MTDGKSVQEMFGSESKMLDFQREVRAMHRSEYRKQLMKVEAASQPQSRDLDHTSDMPASFSRPWL
ncbi:hypothetical protein [Bradyrhizobium sp. USDA 4473]